jgi:hypothetical protein
MSKVAVAFFVSKVTRKTFVRLGTDSKPPVQRSILLDYTVPFKVVKSSIRDLDHGLTEDIIV